MSDTHTRLEHDSLGPVEVPAAAWYGAQTQRAVENFPISGWRMPRPFIRALGLIKHAAAVVNRDLGLLDPSPAVAIAEAALAVAEGRHDDQFPVDVFQTGSGTSTNMNANEVIARLASQASGATVHPNDHVNRSQSSNDVIPSAIHVSASAEVREQLVPAVEHLIDAIAARAEELDDVVTTGRTHLMDAVPVRLSQVLGGWSHQLRRDLEAVRDVQPRLAELALGGTAIGTGLNAPPDFGTRVAAVLAEQTGIPFVRGRDAFALISSQDTAVELSGHLKTLAVSLTKVANDLRWMNSGPVTGFREIVLPALQPGSSIMPGKVNPVIPEAVAMVCAQVIGADTTVTIAGQSGNFQLNVMLPLVAHTVLQSLTLLSRASRRLADAAVRGFEVERDRLRDQVGRNPVIATALAPRLGYEPTAAIVQRATREERSIQEVAAEMTDLTSEELERLLDPRAMTEGGVAS